MRKMTSSLLAISILCLLSIGIVADDKEKKLKEHFEFRDDVLIGTTLVKKGHYLVTYNTETGEMKVKDGDKVVARAKATVKMNDKDWDQDALLTRATSSGEQLTGLRLGGQREELTIIDSA